MIDWAFYGAGHCCLELHYFISRVWCTTDAPMGLAEERRLLRLYHEALVRARPSLGAEYPYEQLCTDWDLVLATALVYTASTKWAAWDAAAKGVMAGELNAIGAAGQVGEARSDRALIARWVELHARRDSPGWGVFFSGAGVEDDRSEEQQAMARAAARERHEQRVVELRERQERGEYVLDPFDLAAMGAREGAPSRGLVPGRAAL